MTDFGGLVKSINGNGAEPRLTREQQLEILAQMTKPVNIRWTQADADDFAAHIFNHVESLRKNLSAAVGVFVKSQVEPLNARIDELERQQANWRYRGVWENGVDYRQNNFVSRDGSLWICLRDTFAQPGTDDTWQLCVKRGKDAR